VLKFLGTTKSFFRFNLCNQSVSNTSIVTSPTRNQCIASKVQKNNERQKELWPARQSQSSKLLIAPAAAAVGGSEVAVAASNNQQLASGG